MDIDFPGDPISQGGQLIPLSSSGDFLRPGPEPAFRRPSLGIDGHHDALAAEFFRGLPDEIRFLHGGGIQRDFVSAGLEKLPDILQGTDSSTNGQGHEDFLGGPAHHIEKDFPAFVGSGDVQESQLVRALFVVHPGVFHRVAGIPQMDEVGSFYHPPLFHIEARNDPFGQHLKPSFFP
jgi:hypothetical protein